MEQEKPRVAWLVWTSSNGALCPQIWYEDGGKFVGPSDLPVVGRHKLAPGRLVCDWTPDRERCTCGALVLTQAFRFANGNVIALDQHGTQMPYYQAPDGVGAARIRSDWPDIEIRPGEMVEAKYAR